MSEYVGGYSLATIGASSTFLRDPPTVTVTAEAEVDDLAERPALDTAKEEPTDGQEIA